jgi:DNA-binding Lrp family transcriptional regulator
MSEEIQGYEELMTKYYGEECVTAMVLLKVESRELDNTANELIKLKNVEDIFLVTGDTDIIFKAKFGNYGELKEFVHKLADIPGLKESKTLLVVTTYKENGKPKPL